MESNRTTKILAGPLAAALFYLLVDLQPGAREVTMMAAITIWVAIWWITEALPLGVTSLVPFVLLPICGIVDSKTIAMEYMDQIIFLFIGGFILAFALEKWNVHKRFASKIISLTGTGPKKILFGVMITTYLLSMWISNTATVMMMISAVMAIIQSYGGESSDPNKKLFAALLLGLAYAATIGGMATYVGTPTNMIFLKYFAEYYPSQPQLSFMGWFVIAFPLSLGFLFITYLILIQVLGLRKIKAGIMDESVSKAHHQPLIREQKILLALFAITVLLWFTRSSFKSATLNFSGWENIFTNPNFISDGTVAIIMAILLFIIPTKDGKDHLMNWNDMAKFPLDIILLFGSGFALAKGFEVSGLTKWIAVHLEIVKNAPLWLLIFVICCIVTIISEFASNVASIQLMLPILAALQQTLDINPALLMVPATLAASLGFMLPIATAPNTIVFATKKIHVKEMAKAGLLVNLTGILLITLFCFLFL